MITFLGALAKLRKETISFVMSVCLSVCMEKSAWTWRIITKFDIYAFLPKICWENSSFIKIRREWRILYMKTFSYLGQYLDKFFLEWEMFHTLVVEKIKAHIWCLSFFRKSCHVWDSAEKCGGAREATNATIWRIRVACWISKATRARTDKYIILVAFSRQQSLVNVHPR